MQRLVAVWCLFSLMSQPAFAQSDRKAVSIAVPGAVVSAPPPVSRHSQSASQAHIGNLARSSYPRTHYQRGLYFRENGDLNSALIEFLKASQENPRLVKAFYQQALIFRERGYLKLAESSLEQALAVDPQYQQARLLLAAVHIQQGNIGGAVSELSRSLGLSPRVAESKDRNQKEETPPADPPQPPPAVLQVLHAILPEPKQETTRRTPEPGQPAVSRAPEKVTGFVGMPGSQPAKPSVDLSDILKGIPGIDPEVSPEHTGGSNKTAADLLNLDDIVPPDNKRNAHDDSTKSERIKVGRLPRPDGANKFHFLPGLFKISHKSKMQAPPLPEQPRMEKPADKAYTRKAVPAKLPQVKRHHWWESDKKPDDRQLKVSLKQVDESVQNNEKQADSAAIAAALPHSERHHWWEPGKRSEDRHLKVSQKRADKLGQKVEKLKVKAENLRSKADKLGIKVKTEISSAAETAISHPAANAIANADKQADFSGKTNRKKKRSFFHIFSLFETSQKTDRNKSDSQSHHKPNEDELVAKVKDSPLSMVVHQPLNPHSKPESVTKNIPVPKRPERLASNPPLPQAISSPARQVIVSFAPSTPGHLIVKTPAPPELDKYKSAPLAMACPSPINNLYPPYAASNPSPVAVSQRQVQPVRPVPAPLPFRAPSDTYLLSARSTVNQASSYMPPAPAPYDSQPAIYAPVPRQLSSNAPNGPAIPLPARPANTAKDPLFVTAQVPPPPRTMPGDERFTINNPTNTASGNATAVPRVLIPGNTNINATPALQPQPKETLNHKQRGAVVTVRQKAFEVAIMPNLDRRWLPQAQQSRTQSVAQAPAPAKEMKTGEPEDEWTKRLRNLAEHGTASLKPGEAFMFSEETGEAVLFRSDGSSIRRNVAPPQDPEEVVRLRRPDIFAPHDLQYNLSLLGKLLPKQPEQPAPVSSAPSDPLANFNVSDVLRNSNRFWEWLKQSIRF